MATENDDWITVQDAAQLSGYHAEYVRILIRKGKIEARKFGPIWAINRSSLLRYLQEAEKSPDGRQGPKYPNR